MSTSSEETLESFETYTQGAEQDQQGTGDLPTYNDVAAQSGPNSRFGRWRGWIEKRAAERYADITPQEIERRRARGWGGDQSSQSVQSIQDPTPIVQEPIQLHSHNRSPHPLQLSIIADLPPSQALPDSFTNPEPSQEPSLHIPEEHLSPTHLSVYHFGSRFLPHSTAPIRCILPIHQDRLLLIGTDTGLSVLNMFPLKWADETSNGETGLMQKGPADAQARVIWTGEAVYQMSILEYEDAGDRTPQGVVLALVGPELDGPSSSGSYPESSRSLRMYNLASLTSLAKWAISQKGAQPIDLQRSSDWHPQESPMKRHRPASSITRGLRSLMAETPMRTRPASIIASPSIKSQSTSESKDSSWDFVNELPLRWATDFTSLSSSGSRMSHTSVISYALWHEGTGRFGRRTLLAVASKTNIFLYETPKGERAFHFVKEFYTPVQPRSLIFVQQSVQENLRSPPDVGSLGATSGYGHNRTTSADPSIPFSFYNPHTSVSAPTYAAQTAIFVLFEKKAGVIRIADSAFMEVEMFESGGGIGGISSSGSSVSVGGSIGTRRSRISLEDPKGAWILPSKVEIPPIQLPNLRSSDSTVYILTRGKLTHVVTDPLPASIHTMPPLYSVTWNSPPSSVVARTHLSMPGHSREYASEPSLQLIGMGDEGVEVHEVPLSYLLGSYKGKGKALADPPFARNPLGETGFLTTGGHWHHYIGAPQLGRMNSMSSCSSESIGTEELLSRVKADEGVYGWWRKEWEDWRIVWLGTTNASDSPDDD